MTIPNILTMTRVVMIPFFIFFLLKNEPYARWLALALFVIASVTDFFDGYLARKLNQDSKFGRFLDPFADKALVVSTIIAFVYLDKLIPIWMIIIIIGRDILITMMRFLAIRKGVEVKTSKLAKAKTAFQMISIFIILTIFILKSYHLDIRKTFSDGRKEGKHNIEIAIDSFNKGVSIIQNKAEVKQQPAAVYFAESLPYFIMLFITLLTAISGLRYLYTNFSILLPPYRRK